MTAVLVDSQPVLLTLAARINSNDPFRRCLAFFGVLLLVLCGYGANAQTQLPHARAIIFEVAPDPHEGALLQNWRGLSVAQRHDISIAVAHRTVPIVLRHLRGSGVLVEQIGSYLDETNPSFALHLEKGDPLKVASLLACTLTQHSVLVLCNEMSFSQIVPWKPFRRLTFLATWAHGMKLPGTPTVSRKNALAPPQQSTA